MSDRSTILEMGRQSWNFHETSRGENGNSGSHEQEGCEGEEPTTVEAWSAVEKTAFERDQASEQLWRLAFSEPSAEALLSFDILARTGGADEIQGTSVDTAAQALEPGVTGVAHRTP